jgi:membrane dipeptidase
MVLASYFLCYHFPPFQVTAMIDRTLRHLTGGGVIWDNHSCVPLRLDKLSFLQELRRVREAGISVVSLNISFGHHDSRSAISMVSAFRAWLQARSEEFVLIRNTADIEKVQATDRLGICFDMEGMDALDGNVDLVHAFYDLGVRWMLATYNIPNAAGGGCLGEDKGLTDFGRRVISEMNHAGMVVCATHCGYRTAREMIDASSTPVIFSHSNPRGRWDHPRNIPDGLMRECAARGGVIGINGFGPFLGDNDASTTTFVTHVEYAIEQVGDDHVGIGLDYVFDPADLDDFIAADPTTFPPHLYSRGPKMVEPWRLPEIGRALATRGHSEVTLRKVFGGNHLRIARSVWRG